MGRLPRILRARGSKPVATLDEQFARRMAALAAATKVEPALRGTTIVYSPIYRVGRSEEDKVIKARIRIDGECHDVAIQEGTSAKELYKAAATERTFPVHLHAVWVRGGDGRLHYDLKHTRIMKVDQTWAPIAGEAFVAAVNEASPSGYQDDEDFDERIELMRRRGSA